MNNSQSGRSMIEMLGVLAIIGVLSVGGLDMVSKARRNNQMNSLVSGISKLVNTFRKLNLVTEKIMPYS